MSQPLRHDLNRLFPDWTDRPTAYPDVIRHLGRSDPQKFSSRALEEDKGKDAAVGYCVKVQITKKDR